MTILFISHDASMTGAPMLLINLAGMLKEANAGHEIRFMIRKPPYHIIEKLEGYKIFYATTDRKKPAVESLVTRVKRRLIPPKKTELFNAIQVEAALKDCDLVISNTITNGALLRETRKYYSGPIISYIHELKIAARRYSTPGDIEAVKSHSNYFAVPSRAVYNFLVDEVGILPEKIFNLPYYIPFEALKNTAAPAGQRVKVGCVGTTDWRKGIDIFLLIAREVKQKAPDAAIDFTWKGGSRDLESDIIINEAEKLGIADIFFLEQQSLNMNDFYQQADIFLLTSREDPFPLVVLEAAAHKIPAIVFAGAGGAQEFVQDSGAGKAVPYLDIAEAANEIINYYHDPVARKADGEKAYQYMKNHQGNGAYVNASFQSVISEITNPKK